MLKSTDGRHNSRKQGRSLSLDGWPVCKATYQRSERLHSSDSQGLPKGQGEACGATWIPADPARRLNTMACVDLNTLQTNGKMRLEIGLKTHMVAISKGTETLRAS